MKISYRQGYKYQLAEDYHCLLPFELATPITSEFIEISKVGWLTIKSGYAWDGPSGPTIDTKNFMRGSLVHDALYQLIREGSLHERYRLDADRILRQICRADGMSAIRAWWVYQSVRHFAMGAARGKKPILTAP